MPTQLRACEDYCRPQGDVLERFYEEGESAKTTDRSQLQALLKYCRTHKGKVHEPAVPRYFVAVGDGADRRHFNRQADGRHAGRLAQFDNDVRSDRTRPGMKAALEFGRSTFLAPLGYLNAPKWSNTSLVHDPERSPLVRQAFEDLATGQYSKQEVIARATEDRG